jgi:hypothetical protein
LKSFEVADEEVDRFPKTSQSARMISPETAAHAAPSNEGPNRTPSQNSSGLYYAVSQAPKTWPPQKSKAFPDFSFVDSNGESASFASLRGKWVLVEPIGMNCPACQAFSGAHKKGNLGGIPPQGGLDSLEEYLTQASVDIRDEHIHLVQLLLYDLQMKAPTLEDAKLWPVAEI